MSSPAMFVKLAFACSLYFTFPFLGDLVQFDLLRYLLTASLGLASAREKVPPYAGTKYSRSPRAFQRSTILLRENSGRLRVQQTVGRQKLRDGLAGCRVRSALPRCPAQSMIQPRRNLLELHAWCPTATTSLSEHTVPTEASKSRRQVRWVKRRQLQVEECFAKAASKTTFGVAS